MAGSLEIRRGSVSEFDEARGLGAVTADDGPVFSFHCTQVTDGSRHIDVGTRVVFSVSPGHLGRVEARALTPEVQCD